MKSVSQIVNDIRRLRIQGANNVAQAAIAALEITAEKSRAKTKKQFVSELEKTALLLSKTRSTEPLMRNSLSRILVSIERHETENTEMMKRYAAKACRDFYRILEVNTRKIAGFGANEICSGDKILVHCHSETVIEILKQAKIQGKKFSVVATETRPRDQGIRTAKELLKAGIPVTYCVDSALGFVMKKCTKALVGCDAILADGSIVNKIGTLPLAIVAQRFGVPVYVAGETLKFDPKTVEGFQEPIEERDPGEVIQPSKLRGAKIINPAFDVVPEEYITALITEKGVMKPEMLRAEMEL
jgi:ribose 1,5-bisphosphate isomerase